MLPSSGLEVLATLRTGDGVDRMLGIHLALLGVIGVYQEEVLLRHVVYFKRIEVRFMLVCEDAMAPLWSPSSWGTKCALLF